MSVGVKHIADITNILISVFLITEFRATIIVSRVNYSFV